MKIRSYIRGDEKEIMELDARELPSEWNRRTLENWYWKFTERNPAGHAFIWVAEHGGHLVGHFAAVPFRLKVFDEVVTGSHTIGALVDKKFQNRGLLKFVGEKLMEDQAVHHIPFTWGFPNRRAHRFENEVLKYNDLLNFDMWKLERGDIQKVREDGAIERIEKFDEGFDRLWERSLGGYEICVVRDSVFLNWRYLERPDWEYFPYGLYEGGELKGYIVYKLFREGEVLRGHIIDIFGQRGDADTFSRLLEHGVGFFSENGVDEVTVLHWGNGLIEGLLRARGFRQEETDIPLIIRINLDHRYSEKVRDKGHWYFSMGDSTEIF